jgi:hypothetical protein
MRAALVLATLIAVIAHDLPSANAADLSLHRTYVQRTIASARPWCVIESFGAVVWSCYPTLAACRPHQLPGTGLYCVRDPIPHRRLVQVR